jgi:putative nucleotidyltransferase with HDIG domain
MNPAPAVRDGARLGAQLTEIVLGRIAGDKLVVPSLPAAAHETTRRLRDPEVTPRQLTEALERDPILAMQAMRLAGSGGVPETIEQAVSRLGVQRLRQPLGEAAARLCGESRDKRITAQARAVWEHALGVALLARDLAALAQAEAPDSAFLAGLLHDIGKPILAGFLLEAERQIVVSRNSPWLSPEEWLRAIADGHRRIGVALAERWGLPKPVARCIQDTTEYDAADRGSPVNFVVFANALCKRAGLYLGPFDADDVGALEVIGRSMLSLPEELVQRLSSGIVDRVRAQLGA